jgi:DNA-binding response OmpR family regulator
MPEMPGVELARRLRAVEPALKVLFVSGYTNDMIDRHGVFERGAALLQKPYAVADLLGAVRDVLGGRPQA